MIPDPNEDVRMSAVNVIARNLPTKLASKMIQVRLDHEGAGKAR